MKTDHILHTRQRYRDGFGDGLEAWCACGSARWSGVPDDATINELYERHLAGVREAEDETQTFWLDGGQFYCDKHRSGIPFYFAPCDAVCAECSGDAPESYLKRDLAKEG